MKKALPIIIIGIVILLSLGLWYHVQSKGAVESSTSITDNDSSLAIERVKAYIEYMQNGKYSEAYDFLSKESKSLHSISEFTNDIKQGMPPLDLSTIVVLQAATGSILISIDFHDEPGTAGYFLTHEDGDWFIVYRGGSPAMPYK